jgi:uncharacterized protein YjiS (DUF1127 family)
MSAHMRTEPERLARGPATEEWARIDPMIYITAARRLQAQAMAEAAATGWRSIRRGLTGLADLARRYLLEPIGRRTERRRALAELAAMDDRLLADIGLRRGDIELAVDGRLADPRVTRRAPVPTPVLTDRVLESGRGAARGATANGNRPTAQPEQAPDLAA